MMNMMMQMMMGGGGGGGHRGKFHKKGGIKHSGGKRQHDRELTDSRDDDPPGSCRVYVMGMDFDTTDEQFEGHMKQAGPIHAVYWIKKGKAVVVYKKKASAAKAAALDGSTIDGNSRYITVKTGSD